MNTRAKHLHVKKYSMRNATSKTMRFFMEEYSIKSPTEQVKIIENGGIYFRRLFGHKILQNFSNDFFTRKNVDNSSGT
jgi:hypothetical protein